uniref:Protein lifeguard 1-like n=1 Tax=Stegastes partitus TaxID=144197 RepID=A0A3B5A6G1_9TELE
FLSSVSSRMSAAADASESKQTPPSCDVSSPPPPPPPYTYQEQQPPAYSAAPATYDPSKTDTTSPSDTTPLISSSSFDDRTVRRGFIRKVFSIVTLQLLFTFSVVCVFTFSSEVKKAVQDNLWVYFSSFIIFLVVALVLSLCKSFRRRHPWNIVGLVVVTLSLSYMVGTVASFHNTIAVVVTMGVTLAISFFLFYFQTRYDFTYCYGFMLILAVDVIMFGFFCTFYYSYVAEVAYGCLGALFFSMFLMIDCQLLMGTFSYRLDPEEYISAALTIYLDIVLIFLYLLGRR